MVTKGLSIRDLAERTGVTAATLRSWESRYGAPAPGRLPGGHRRYTEADVAFVAEVQRLRDGGLGLAAAIARAGADPVERREATSLFAALRERHPHLPARSLSKTTLLALTRAMEDECMARAERPILFAGFQESRFYESSRGRWEHLAETADEVVVLADFDASPPGTSGSRDAGTPHRVHLPADAPLRREWLLVCDSPGFAACITGWEPPGGRPACDRNRRFETLWTLDPVEVRDAARICAAITDRFAPGTSDRLDGRLSGTPAAASSDLRRARGLFDRMVSYLDRVTSGGAR